jgi:hypothetical protein
VEFGLSSTFLEPRLPGRLRRNYSMLEYRGRPSHSLNFPGSISGEWILKPIRHGQALK